MSSLKTPTTPTISQPLKLRPYLSFLSRTARTTPCVRTTTKSASRQVGLFSSVGLLQLCKRPSSPPCNSNRPPISRRRSMPSLATFNFRSAEECPCPYITPKFWDAQRDVSLIPHLSDDVVAKINLIIDESPQTTQRRSARPLLQRLQTQ